MNRNNFELARQLLEKRARYGSLAFKFHLRNHDYSPEIFEAATADLDDDMRNKLADHIFEYAKAAISRLEKELETL